MPDMNNSYRKLGNSLSSRYNAVAASASSSYDAGPLLRNEPTARRDAIARNSPTRAKGSAVMSASSNTWKDKLQHRISPDMAREIDQFEAQMTLRKGGKIEEKVFAETR